MVAFVACLLATVGQGSARPRDFFVSPAGQDSNAGTNWTAPIATLQHAVQLAGSGSATIHVRGTLRISSPIVVDHVAALTIVGERGARISGGVLVDNWKLDHLNGLSVWSAKQSFPSRPYEMFVGARRVRAIPARIPSRGFLHFAAVPNPNGPWNEGRDQANFAPDDLPALEHPEDAEIVIHQLWVTSRVPIASINRSQSLFKFAKKSVFKLNDARSDQPSNYYLSNVSEGLKNPRDWYWDSRNSTVYYVPAPGESIRGFVAEIPMMESLISVRNSSNVKLSNLELTGSEFIFPATSSGDMQAATSVSAAVELQDCQAAF